MTIKYNMKHEKNKRKFIAYLGSIFYLETIKYLHINKKEKFFNIDVKNIISIHILLKNHFNKLRMIEKCDTCLIYYK